MPVASRKPRKAAVAESERGAITATFFLFCPVTSRPWPVVAPREGDQAATAY